MPLAWSDAICTLRESGNMSGAIRAPVITTARIASSSAVSSTRRSSSSMKANVILFHGASLIVTFLTTPLVSQRSGLSVMRLALSVVVTQCFEAQISQREADGFWPPLFRR